VVKEDVMLSSLLTGIFERIISILADRCIFCQPEVPRARRRVPDGPPVEVDLYVVRDHGPDDCYYFTPTKHMGDRYRMVCTGDGHFRCPECYYHFRDPTPDTGAPDAR
jgi:hypothetical protein